MANIQILPQIVDAFVYNTLYNRPHKPYNYFTLQLQRLDALRRQQGLYRMRQFITPQNLTTSVASYGSLFDQLRITPGSYIWALTFCVLAPGLITDFTIQLTDHDTGDLLSSTPMSGGISNYPLLSLLSEPRPVLGSGQLDVNMLNRASGERTPQLVVSVAEPCALVGNAK